MMTQLNFSKIFKQLDEFGIIQIQYINSVVYYFFIIYKERILNNIEAILIH